MAKKKVKNINLNKIGEIISDLMESCEIDASELSQQTGLPCSTISRLRSNNTKCSPNLSSLIPIADFFCITISQLIGEEPINQIHNKFKPSKIKRFPIPVLNSETILDYLETNTSTETQIINIDLQVSEKTFAYFLQGNAMEPQFPDKTLLIIDPTIEIENLDHILVIPSGKRLPIFRQILIDGEEKYIRALNPAFNEFVKLTTDSHTILGVMVQSRQNFKDIHLPSTTINTKQVNAS